MGKVLVIGSINMDIVIGVEHMPVGGENVYVNDVELICGGKGANQAGATAKLGLDTVYFGCVGQDENGKRLIDTLQQSGIDTSYMKVKDGGSGQCYIIVEGDGQNRILVSPGANEKMTVEDIDQVILPLIPELDMILTQLEIPLECVERIVQLGKEHGVKVFVDAGPIRGCKAEQLRGAWCISPNETELGALVERKVQTEEEIVKAAEELLALDVECVLVKLGGSGCLYISKDERIRQKSYKVNVVDTTAAGDSFSAGFAVGVLENKSTKNAIDYATKCGAIAVTKKGASPSLPTKEAVMNFEKEYLRNETL